MSHAISLDSLLNLPAMGIPVVNYSPESTWEFGAAAQGYFRLPNQTRTSILQVDGTYSLNRQWYINTQGTLYFGRKNHPTPPYTTLHHPTLHNNKKNIWNTDQKQSVSSPQEAMHQV